MKIPFNLNKREIEIILIALSLGAILQASADFILIKDMIDNSVNHGMKIKSGNKYYIVEEFIIPDNIKNMNMSDYQNISIIMSNSTNRRR